MSNNGTSEFHGTSSPSDIGYVVVPAGSTGVTADYINDATSAQYDNLSATVHATGVAGSLATTTAGVAATTGTKAVDTIVVGTGATTPGNVTVTVDGTPVTVALPGTSDTTTTDAGAIESALSSNATVSAAYTVAGSGSDVTLTQKTASATQPVVSFADTGTTGAAATQLVTTTGVAPISATDGVYTYTFSAGATYAGSVTFAVDGTSVIVPVTAGETAAQVAAAVNTALNGNATITTAYTVTNSAGSAAIVFTQKTASATGPVVTLS